MRASGLTIRASDVWNWLSPGTGDMDIDVSADNDATYVTVLNVASGSGLLVAIGGRLGGTASAVTVKITVDGGTPVETSLDSIGASSAWSLAIMTAFVTSLKVEMKLGGAQDADYWVVSIVA